MNVTCSFVAHRSDPVQLYRIRAVKASVDQVGSRLESAENPYPEEIHRLYHHCIGLACWHHGHDREIGSVDAGRGSGSDSGSWCFVVALRSQGLNTRQFCSSVRTEHELTHLAAAYSSSLFLLKCLNAGIRIKKLHKTVRLLYRYLCELAMLVEDVEEVALRDFLSWEVSFAGSIQVLGIVGESTNR